MLDWFCKNKNFKSYIKNSDNKRKNVVVTESVSDTPNTVIDWIVELIKDSDYYSGWGSYGWSDEDLFYNYVVLAFVDEYDIFTENFMKKNYDKIEKAAFKKYGIKVDGIKIYNFKNERVSKISDVLNGEDE